MLSIILYTLLYIKKEQKQTEKEGKKRKRKLEGDRNSTMDAAAILASSSPLFRSVCRPHRPNHRQRSPSHQIAPAHKEGKSGHTAPTLCDVIATTSPPINQQPTKEQHLETVCHPSASCLLPAASSRLPRSLVPLFFLISSARSCLTFCPPLSICQVVRG